MLPLILAWVPLFILLTTVFFDVIDKNVGFIIHNQCCFRVTIGQKYLGSKSKLPKFSNIVSSTDPLYLRDGPLEKLWGRRGIFEPQEFFFVIKFLV